MERRSVQECCVGHGAGTARALLGFLMISTAIVSVALGEECKIVPKDAAASAEFGTSVCISGNYAIVGAPKDDDDGWASGSAYIFVRDGNTWVQQKKINSKDMLEGDHFGTSVCISGDYAIVGAPKDDEGREDSGSAYIFVRNRNVWYQHAKLRPGDQQKYKYFGSSVSISGNYAIVGAWGDDYADRNSGAAYIFEKPTEGWSDMTETRKLVAPDAEFGDLFGKSVSICELSSDGGVVAIVGAPWCDDVESHSGSAYIFIRQGGNWVQQAKLSASDAARNDDFGTSVCISPDYAISGAPAGDDRAGSAYIFKRPPGGWFDMTETARLFAYDAVGENGFGKSVSISGEYAIVGAFGIDDPVNTSGNAYVFKRDQEAWKVVEKLLASDIDEGDRFGSSVCICGDIAIVGAYGHDAYGGDSGSAYIYSAVGSMPSFTLKYPNGGEWWIEQSHRKITWTFTGLIDDVEIEISTDGGSSWNIIVSSIPNVWSYTCAVPGAPSTACLVRIADTRDNSVWDMSDETFTIVSSFPGYECKLVAGDEVKQDFFGHSVSVSEDYAVVGAAWDDVGGDDAGSAYVFIRNGYTWVEQAKLIPADLRAGMRFGFSVAISEGHIAVGAYGDDHTGSRSGSAYIFVRDETSWLQQVKLIASDADTEDDFGASVSISGDYAVVGAHLNDDAGKNSGAAYIFEKPAGGWRDMTETAKLIASDGSEWDCFGCSVAISSRTAIVGADGDESAYIFIRDRNTWTQQAKLVASDGEPYDNFGCSVGTSGDMAIVGAYLDDDAGKNSGSAYIFVCDGDIWSQQAKLLANDAAAGHEFGYSVAISGDIAIVGAHEDDHFGRKSGSAYIFVRDGNTWIQQDKIFANDIAPGDEFGTSVAISGNARLDGKVAIVGTDRDGDTGLFSGAAYTYFPIPYAPSDVEQRHNAETERPVQFSLAQNYPNPFNPTTTITYYLPEAEHVCLDLYNITGQHVATLVSQHQKPGHYAVSWDASGVANGVYFYRMVAGPFKSTRRMVLLK